MQNIFSLLFFYVWWRSLSLARPSWTRSSHSVSLCRSVCPWSGWKPFPNMLKCEDQLALGGGGFSSWRTRTTAVCLIKNNNGDAQSAKHSKLFLSKIGYNNNVKRLTEICTEGFSLIQILYFQPDLARAKRERVSLCLAGVFWTA